MPYSGTSDPNLPSNVRGLSDKRKRQWLEVYNSARARGMDDGRAITIANGVVKKALGHPTGEAGKRSIDELVLEGWNVEDALDLEIVARWPDEDDGLGAASPTEAPVESGERAVGFVDGLMEFFRGRPQVSETQLSLREMPDGRLRYYAIATNNYTDRGDIRFPEVGQRRYEAFVAATGRYPELWQWHARGSRFGQADKLWFGDHFQFTSGLIDKGKEELALRVMGQRDIAMSHGYLGRHVELPDGVVEVPEFIQFEQSVLPRKAAANYGTYFGLASGAREAREGEVAKFTDEQRTWFRSNGESDERIAEMERLTTEMQDFFARRGVDFRSVEMAEGDPSPATPPASNGGGENIARAGDGTAAAAGSGGGAVTPSATTPPASASGSGLTDEEVRRIAREAVTAALEPVLAEVRSIGTGVRALQESDDAKVAGAWTARAASLPQGFKASAQGAAPAAGSREAAAVGAGSGGAGSEMDLEWIDKMFGMHPMLGGGNGAGAGGGQ